MTKISELMGMNFKDLKAMPDFDATKMMEMPKVPMRERRQMPNFETPTAIVNDFKNFRNSTELFKNFPSLPKFN